MAYNRDKIYEQAEEAIKKHNLFFIEDIVAFIPCNKDTFYRFFPTDSDEYDKLREFLDDNKVKTKSSIRAKLWKSNKASELLALYRLIATPEEHQKLNQSYVDHTTKGESLKEKTYTPKEAAQRLKEIEDEY
jgi:ATP phosphoribosyltransferase regulatory subunit HisZ